MVGEGVLHECLHHDAVEQVLVINRKPCGYTHPKLTEIIHTDFYNIEPIKHLLIGYNACYFCLGVSSVGLNEEQFTKPTYTLTMHIAGILSEQNPDMTFCYVSGSGTNATGRQMWQKVKGRTENELMALPFKQVFAFRPGVMVPTAGLKNTIKAYSYFSWLFPILKIIAPNIICTLAQVGQSMIQVTLHGYKSKVLEVSDIKLSAQ